MALYICLRVPGKSCCNIGFPLCIFFWKKWRISGVSSWWTLESNSEGDGCFIVVLGDMPKNRSYCLMVPEIRRSPVEVGSLSHCLQGLIHATSGCLGFLKHQQYFFWRGSDLWASWLSELACLMEPPSSTVSCSEKARGIPPSHMEISSWARKLKQPTNTKCSNCRTRAICWTVTLSLFMTILFGMFCFPQASLLLKGCPALPAQCWKL